MKRNVGVSNVGGRTHSTLHSSIRRRWKAALALLSVTGLIAGALILFPSRPTSVAARSVAACCSDPDAPLTVNLSTSSEDTAAERQTPADPPGTIDGARNPELIPDEVAYRLLMLAIAEPEDATEEQKARARAKISAAGLSPDDEDLFLALVDQFVIRINAIGAQAAQMRGAIPLVHPDSVEGRLLTELAKKERDVLQETIGAAKTRLTIVGSTKLDSHVQSIKRSIKLFPPPPNMPTF